MLSFASLFNRLEKSVAKAEKVDHKNLAFAEKVAKAEVKAEAKAVKVSLISFFVVFFVHRLTDMIDWM